MNPSLNKKKINSSIEILDISKTLDSYLETSLLTPYLNEKLNKKQLTLSVDLLNTVSKEEFIALSKKKISLPYLKPFLNSTLIDNKEDYLKQNIVYSPKYIPEVDKEFGSLLPKSYWDVVCWNHDLQLNVSFIAKDESLLRKMTSFHKEIDTEGFQNGQVIGFNNYKIHKDSFSPEFVKSFIDYSQNYDVYINHPRVGKNALDTLKEQLIEMERASFYHKLLVDFEHIVLEIK